MKKSSWPLVILLILAASGCAPKVDIAAEEAAIRAADSEWLKAAQAKHLDHFLSFYADDASIFPPNAPLAAGKDAGRSLWAPLMANPGFDLRWQTTKVDVSKGGELAWAQETYEFRFQDADGKLRQVRGKAVVVWKKQVDGSWKAVADIFNSDLPAQSAATE